MTPVVEKLGLRRRRLGRRAPRRSWSRPAGTCTPTPSSPSPSSRPPPSSSSGCARTGSTPRRLPTGTGLVCEVGSGDPVVVLRADIDALPLPDLKDVPYASTREGMCHACGHDVHTTVAARRRSRAGHAGRPARHGARRSSSRPRRPSPAAPSRWSPPACWTAPRGRSRCTATRRCRPGTIGLRTGADHRRLRPDRRHAHRPRRAHRPPAAHRRPGRRARPADHRPARRCSPGRSTRGRACRWSGARSTPGIAANAIPQRGTLRGTVRVLDRDAVEGRRGPDALARRAGRRHHRRRVRRRLRARPAAGGQRPARGRPACAPPRWRPWAATTWCCRRRAWAARTSAGSPR